MTHLLAAEWLKMRKRWMPRFLTLIMLALLTIFFWGSGAQRERANVIMPRAWVAAVYFSALIALVLWPILGGSWAGNEYGWGTVRMILSRRPNRLQWALAALIMLVIAVGLVLVAAVILGSVAGTIVALLTAHSVFLTSGLPGGYGLIIVKSFLASWYVLAFYVILAYAAGTIFRSAAFGVGAGIGFSFAQLIAFGIFQGLGGTWKDIASHFPYEYTTALIQRLSVSGGMAGTARTPPDTPSIGASLLGMAIYLVILIGVTLFMVRARDVTA